MLKKMAEDWHVPNDFSRQSYSFAMVEHHASKIPKVGRVLDLGCGTGTSASLFAKLMPASKWIGLDIEESPEVTARTDGGQEFLTFDGINIPFSDNTFDLIFSNQVLEHVHYPTALLKEARRY